MTKPPEAVIILKGGPFGALSRDFAAMKTALEQISEGPPLKSLGLPVLPSGAPERDWLHQERTLNEAIQKIATETLAALESSDIAGMPNLRWVPHDATFSSLMLGRIEIAQVSRGDTGDVWFYTLRFCKSDERMCYSEPTEEAAKAICEAHVEKALFA